MMLLSAELMHEIEQAARLAYPAECCGLLEGRCLGSIVSISQCHPCFNMAVEPERAFEIDSVFHLKLQRVLRNGPTSVVGIYHSHPNGASHPSQSDLECVGGSDLVWLITSVSTGKRLRTAGFRLRESRSSKWFEAEPICTTKRLPIKEGPAHLIQLGS